jgi:hypothetical protein
VRFVLFKGLLGCRTLPSMVWSSVRAASQDGAPRRASQLLVNENEAMRGQMLRLEDRLSVMERIATDSSMNLGREIERLR